MGMDVHGLNPKQNKKIEEFPVFYKYKKMEQSDANTEISGFQQKWKELDADEELSEKYWKESHEYEEANPGYYFRNNVWWWRPLWNYCWYIAEELLEKNLRLKKYETDEDGETNFEKYEWKTATYDDGHGNSGVGLDEDRAKELGEILMSTVADGSALQYQVDYMQMIEDLPLEICGYCNGNNRGHNKMKDCKTCGGTGKVKSFNTHYPFDVDNVEEFAKFCIESGGFEIC